jgi:hypothetical protein
MFAWRAFSNILPYKTIFDEGILPAFTYEMCNEDLKTLFHALWECSSSRLVWDQLDDFNRLQCRLVGTWENCWHGSSHKKLIFPSRNFWLSLGCYGPNITRIGLVKNS